MRSVDIEAATKFVDEFAHFVTTEKMSPEHVSNVDKLVLHRRRMLHKPLSRRYGRVFILS